MKRIALLLLSAICLGANVCFGQTPTLFPLQYVDTNNNFFYSYKNDAGETITEAVPASSIGYLAKRDSSGNLMIIDSTDFGRIFLSESGVIATIWEKECHLKFPNGNDVTLPGTYMDHQFIYSDLNLTSLTDVVGGVVVSSMEYLTPSSHTTYLRKYDNSGNFLWGSSFPGRLRSFVPIDSSFAIVLENEDYGTINVLSVDLTTDGTIKNSTQVPGFVRGAWTSKLFSNGKVGFVAHENTRSSLIQVDPVTMQIDTNWTPGVFWAMSLSENNNLVVATGYSLGASSGMNTFAFDLNNGNLISYLVNTNTIHPEQPTYAGKKEIFTMKFATSNGVNRVYLGAYDLPSITAGIHYVPQSSNISVFPTSTTDSWNIKGNEEAWHLINAIGQIVRTGSGSGTINTEDLSSGNYTFVFRNKTQKVQKL